ncbi:MAG TPA: hypothetical protein ENL37_06910 [Desulfobacteraceae bacterium]|nr:hypothetical protein [Desulfobacteraceae bacterium]
MAKTINNDDWLWVVVQDPGGKEQFLGQQEKESNISFIPMFKQKEDALMCMSLMTRDKKIKYEPQAVIYSELKEQTANSGFLLYLLDSEGRVIEK